MNGNDTADLDKIARREAWRTAISRDELSAPMRYLRDHARLRGRILDYGCGRGDDARHLAREGLEVECYDPHWSPAEPLGGFDTITCLYVLNVVTEAAETEILARIRSLLVQRGYPGSQARAYIGVRRDVDRDGLTTKGTYQRNVVLNLPVLYESRARFTIYEMRSK